MSTTITMPQLGETVTEGTVAQWLKRVGDSVEKYEAFVEVSTDKVNAEVPSPVSGVIRELIAKEGETVPTGAPIAIIDEVGAKAVAPPSAPPPERERPPERPAREIAAVQPSAAQQRAGAKGGLSVAPSSYGAPGAAGTPASNGATRHAGAGDEGPRRVSPAVRRLAREHGLDLKRVPGTGSDGRITANDVVATAERVAAAAAATAPALPDAAQPPSERPATRPSVAAPVPGETIPLTQARKIIAQRMLESKHTAPHAWTMVEVDVTNLWQWRASEKDRFSREKGYALTLLPFFLHAVVQSLRVCPLMNARFGEDGILVHRDVNLGIAIALESNLVVPVIRDADNLSIAGLAVAAGYLIERARTGKLSADEMAGGTFTVNNTGANGSILSAPIINGGQAGIVTMEAVVKRPVVIEGDAIAIRSMMNVCLSLDHRVLDGAVASAFLLDLKKRLQAMGPAGPL
jgi:2-oxoisovalerate dehydrogenase E2 component (dihydrolipoyl transacylase)